MDEPVSDSYAKRLTRVSAYIHDHLDEDLTVDALADVACLSPYHWHRIYHGYFGETLAATVKRLRLQRAAADLAHTDKPISEIAARALRQSGLVHARLQRCLRIAARQVPRGRQPLGLQSLTPTGCPSHV